MQPTTCYGKSQFGVIACDNPDDILPSRSGHVYYSIQLITQLEPDHRTGHTDSYVRPAGRAAAERSMTRAEPGLRSRKGSLRSTDHRDHICYSKYAVAKGGIKC